MLALEAVAVAVEGLTERRTLLRFMRYGLLTQLVSLVRGSSRRITIVRFRPADIRVINRRIGSLAATTAASLHTLPEILATAFLYRHLSEFT